MFLELFVPLLVLALVDSINPSAIVVAGILLVKSEPDERIRNLLAYVSGVFGSYLIIGALLLLALHAALDAAKAAGDSDIVLIFQAVVGGAILTYAIFAPSKLSPEKQQRQDKWLQKSLKPRLLVRYGAYVTIVELITALPYFAALGLLAKANLSATAEIPLLIVYCMIFVAPPLIMGYVYSRHKARFERWLERRRGKGKQAGRETLLWIMGIVGFMLLAGALTRLFDF